MSAVLPCRRGGESIDQMPPQVVADFLERTTRQPKPVIHICLIGWSREVPGDVEMNGSTFAAVTALDASRIDPEVELLTRKLKPGFVVRRCFVETRESLMAKPIQERKSFRSWFEALLNAERDAAGLKRFDAVDRDHALDSYSHGYAFSRD